MQAEELLADIAWLRRFASRLVGGDAAEDLVQETWLQALRRAPEERGPWRPWLAKVLRDLLRMRRRGERRRTVREEASALFGAELPTPEQLVARAETGRLLVDGVLALGEPFRGTVLLHFHEGLSLAAIARAQGVPAGTVRWRLKVALERVRKTLDARDGRKQWSVAVLAFSKGVASVERNLRRAAVISLLALLVVGGALVGMSGSGGSSSVPEAPASAPPARPGTRAAAPPVAGAAGYGEQLGVKPRPIRGRVVADGRAVVGAEVILADFTSEIRALSDGGGRFAFAPPRAAFFMLSATAPGFTVGTARADAIDPLAHEVVIELQPCAAKVFGTISDAAGTPIAGAMVRQWADRPNGPVVRADDRGRYEVCVPRGASRLAFAAVGFGTMRADTLAHSRHRLDVTLAPEGSVLGRIIEATSGAPIADVRVNLWPRTRGTSNAMVTGVSDADGQFQIDGAAPGRYAVEAWAADHLLVTPVEVSIEAARIAGPIEVALEAGARVGGVVRQHGAGVAGAQVRLVAKDMPMTNVAGVQARSFVGVTQEDGSFSLRGIRRGGTYAVEVVDREVLSPRSVAIDSPEKTGVEIDVASLGVIAGRARRSDGPAASGAKVQASHQPGVAPVTATADTDGWFELRGLGVGRYAITAEGADGTSRTSKPVTVDLAAQGRVEGVEVMLDGTASVAGVVVDENGAPLEGVEVEIVGPIGRVAYAPTALTTAEGRFEVTPLVGGGVYRATVRPFRNAWKNLPPVAGAWPDIEIPESNKRVEGLRLAVTAKGSEISGVVRDEDGALVPDAWVRAAPELNGGPSELGGGVQFPMARSDEDGTFHIRVLGDGPFMLQGQLGSEAPVLVSHVAAGARDVEIRVSRPGGITGIVVGVSDAPIVASRIGPVVWNGTYLGRVTDGAFRIENVAPGHYELTTISPDGRAGQAAVDVRSGAISRVEITGRAGGRIVGRAVHRPDQAPLAGLRCSASPMLGLGGGLMGMWKLSPTATTDADGRFELAPMPSGSVLIRCMSESVQGDSKLVDVPADAAVTVTLEIAS